MKKQNLFRAVFNLPKPAYFFFCKHKIKPSFKINIEENFKTHFTND